MAEDDPFWSIQLANNAENRHFVRDAPLAGHNDHALPAGAPITEHSLAGVLGCEREVSIPVCNRNDRDKELGGRSIISSGDDDGGGGGGGSGKARAVFLVLRLRHVNGNGVLSGVGGDVWCAALLLSTWLLTTPEVVQGLDVLELGSGLGLCGIVAGYLAERVILTDYVDELIVNLSHNVEINRWPRLDEILYPPSAVVGNQSTNAAANSQRRRQRRDVSQSAFRSLSPARVRVCKLDWTEFEQREGTRNGRSQETGVGGHADTDWWWDDTGDNSVGSFATQQTLGDDDEDEEAEERAGDAGKQEGERQQGEQERQGDEGEQVEEEGNAHVEAALRCDVVIGSALIYSPHHACVANVLSRAFTDGGCRAAHIIQLHTRPGFDEFLVKLGSCGLRYRLRRICDVLPKDVLDEIRRTTPATVVGGPVTATNGATDEIDIRRDGGGNEQRGYEEDETAEDIAATGFDEFVLCSVSRADGDDRP